VNKKTLTHLDSNGSARMVDVGNKPATQRRAIARAVVRMAPTTRLMVMTGKAEKGDVLAAARIAGIQAAKRTSELIPLCHPIAITSVELDIREGGKKGELHLTATVKTMDRTGVEMEALTAVSVAALTIYDMVKAVDRGMTIENIALTEKTGGLSNFKRTTPAVKSTRNR
jgi:cyclic pyranopterin phosphate synthase